MADEPTLGEIGRGLELLRTEQGKRFDNMDKKFEGLGLTYIRKDLYDANTVTLTGRIEALEEENAQIKTQRRTLIYLVFSALLFPLVVAAIIALVFTSGGH